MTVNEDRPPVGVDASRPSPARVWDYFLDGKDNHEVDRQAAEMILSVAPDMRLAAQGHRRFLARAVATLARSGIRQFIDLGTGLPTSPNVHEVAREVDESARVVYVDFDPLVVAHCGALVSTTPGVTAVQGDVRRPGEILDDPEVLSLIEFDEPVGVLFVAVLPFVSDEEQPEAVVARFRERMAPGSYVAIAHASAHSDPDALAQAEAAFARTPNRPRPRTRDEILRMFDGFELIEPGLVDVDDWRPDTFTSPPLVRPGMERPPTKLRAEAGVGRKPL